MTHPTPQELEAAFQALWTSSLGTIRERVETLRAAHRKLEAGSLDLSTRKEAESAAHRLAGILGTFGLPEGSHIASGIEQCLSGENTLTRPQVEGLKQKLEELNRLVESKAAS